jgi:predicted GNAT family acetyltransferase
MEDITFNDNTQAQRFELIERGTVVGIAQYTVSGNTVTMTHTEVPQEYKGKGYGSKLARLALDRLREKQMKVIPSCQFIARFIHKHQEYADLTRL